MPSKKKNSKSASRLSNSDHPPSPRSPSLLSSSSPDVQFTDCLREASARYPSLIGDSAFIGTLINVVPESRGCKIWLSESSMVASSLRPGSIVSVSLAVSDRILSNSSPLDSMYGECMRRFEVEAPDEIGSEVGNYFALAVVFPSSKALKDGVLLSSNLFNTIGCPASGRVIFVYPLHNHCPSGLVNANGKPHNSEVDNLTFSDCWELYLELVPFKNSENLNDDFTSLTHSSENTNEQSSNGEISSPKMPLYQQKVSPTSPCPSATPKHEAIYQSSCSRNSNLDLFDVKEALMDDSAKQLLHACVNSWLYSRILLCGNFVAVPILSRLCLFRVTKASKLLDYGTNEHLIRDKNDCQALEAMDHVKDAFIINHDTKVCIKMPMNSTSLHLPTNSESKTPLKSIMAMTQVESKCGKNNVSKDISKVGGLDKEYAVLKDIIMLSVKNNLSRGCFYMVPLGQARHLLLDYVPRTLVLTFLL